MAEFMEAFLQKETQSPPQAEKSPKKKKWFGKKAACLLILLILAAAGSFAVLRGLGGQQAAAAIRYQEAAAEARDITRSLTACGTLVPADSFTVSTLVSGVVLSDTFEEGDLVEKDQLLYTLDASDAATSQTQAQNSYSQAQRSYTQAVESMYPTADISGTVKEVYVKNGDAVSNGTQLCSISGDNKICVDFAFTYADSSDFYVGQSATIYIDGFAGTLAGTVQQVSQSATVSGSGPVVTTVRVTAANPGLVTSDYTAKAVIGNYSSYANSVTFWRQTA